MCLLFSWTVIQWSLWYTLRVPVGTVVRIHLSITEAEKPPSRFCPNIPSSVLFGWALGFCDWFQLFLYFKYNYFYSYKKKRIHMSVQETREILIWSLGREDPLQKETATHCIILPEESYRQRNLMGYGLQSMVSQKSQTQLMHKQVYGTLTILLTDKTVNSQSHHNTENNTTVV